MTLDLDAVALKPSPAVRREGERVVPPLSTSRLVSRAFVRARLRGATGALVRDETVAAVVARLESDFERLVTLAAESVAQERRLRSIHGVYPRPTVRVKHVRAEASRAALKNPESYLAHDAGTFARQGVYHDTNESECA